MKKKNNSNLQIGTTGGGNLSYGSNGIVNLKPFPGFGVVEEGSKLDKYVQVFENPGVGDTKKQEVSTELLYVCGDTQFMVTIYAEGASRTYYFPADDCEVGIRAEGYGTATWDSITGFGREVIRNEMGINDVDDDE